MILLYFYSSAVSKVELTTVCTNDLIDVYPAHPPKIYAFSNLQKNRLASIVTLKLLPLFVAKLFVANKFRCNKKRSQLTIFYFIPFWLFSLYSIFFCGINLNPPHTLNFLKLLPFLFFHHLSLFSSAIKWFYCHYNKYAHTRKNHLDR